MNILHLSAAKNWGGGENHIENLCRELQHLAPEVRNRVFCIENGLFQERLRSTNIKVELATLAFKMDPRYIYRLIRVCMKQKIDIIHIHDTTALTLAVMADNISNLPPFVLSKKTSFPIKPRKRTLYKYNYPKIKKVLCVSKATQLIAGEQVLEHAKLQCIYHGTNIHNTRINTTVDLRKKLQLDDEKIIIGNIANHIRAKNLETFIKVAFELVHVKKRKDVHFIQIGAFTKRTDALILQIREMDLENHLSLLDDIPGASGLIPQFNISLMTSQSEGMPQFIYESFYQRVPVVSTDVGGIREIVEHGETGLLSPAHDTKALAAHVELLINSPELGKKFTTHSRETIEKHFTSEMMASQTLDVYREIIYGRD